MACKTPCPLPKSCSHVLTDMKAMCTPRKMYAHACKAESGQYSTLISTPSSRLAGWYLLQAAAAPRIYYRPMGLCRAVALFVLPFGLLLLRSLPSSGQENAILQPEEACADFATGTYPGSSWTLEDCIEVWTRYDRTVPSGLKRRLPYADSWREAASEMRRRGSPCLVASDPISDGAGSTIIRHLAAWIFAEEMGCDWVMPDWGEKLVNGGNGTVMYCHMTATKQEMDLSKSRVKLQSWRRCSVINWVAYFQFDVPSVSMPEGGAMKIIKARGMYG